MSAKHKIAEKDMIRLVEEVSKLDAERQQLLDKTQVATILNELNLPSDLLDEALDRLSTKKERESTLKKRLITVAAIVIVIASIAGAVLMKSMNDSHALSMVTADQPVVAYESRAVDSLKTVSPGRTIFFKVTLRNAPVGTKLPMFAKWYKPNGSIFHTNDWTTKTITTPVWDTHAKCTLPSSVEKGKWKVEISVSGNTVCGQDFIVE